MTGKTQLEAHLSAEDLYARYRAAEDPVERSHLQIIWLLACGKSQGACAAATGYCTRWISKLAQRYNAHGPGALGDRRGSNAGAAALLDAELLAALAAALGGEAPGGGLWSGPKVAAWIAARTGRDHVHPQRGWDYLKRLGYSRQMPRPRHERAASPEQQTTFKKNFKLQWTKPARPIRGPGSKSGPSTSTASA